MNFDSFSERFWCSISKNSARQPAQMSGPRVSAPRRHKPCDICTYGIRAGRNNLRTINNRQFCAKWSSRKKRSDIIGDAFVGQSRERGLAKREAACVLSWRAEDEREERDELGPTEKNKTAVRMDAFTGRAYVPF